MRLSDLFFGLCDCLAAMSAPNPPTSTCSNPAEFGCPEAVNVDWPLMADWSRLAFANERPGCTSLLTFGSSWRCSWHGSDIEPIEVVIQALSCLVPKTSPARMRCRASVIAAAHYTFMHKYSASEPSRPGRATDENPTA